MRRSRGKTVALWLGAAALMLLLGTAVAFRAALRESFWLRVLKIGGDGASGLSRTALEHLAEVGSERSVAIILEHASAAWTEAGPTGFPEWRDHRYGALVLLCWKDRRRALPLLRPWLESADVGRRRTALRVILEAMGVAWEFQGSRTPSGGELVDSVLREIRSWIDEHAERETVPLLVPLLEDPDERVRHMAIDCLGAMPESAIPVLETAVAHPDPYVRSRAATGLGKHGAASSRALPALLALLRDPDAELRDTAVRSLGEIGAKRSDVADALAGVVADRNESVGIRCSAAVATGSIGLGTEKVRAALEEAQEDSDRWIRKLAAEALEKIHAEATR